MAYDSVHIKILVGEKLTNLANREPFTKIFLSNIHRYTETYMAYALTVAYSPIAFTYLYGSPKFSPAKYFLCTVTAIHRTFSG